MPHYSKYGFVFLCALAFSSFGFAQADKPNILFILTDNQAASLLGAYGNPDIKTPHLDRLAQEGMRFDRHYAVNGLCSPTRATLMTGLMPSQHGVHSWLNDHFLEEWPRDWVAVQEFRTLPLTLKNRGYKTAMIGKWHLGQPWEPAIGFETWVTFPLGHTVDFWNNTIINNDRTYTVNDQHIVDHFTDLAVEYIENYNDDEPFYLQLNYDGPYMNPPTNAGPARNRYYPDYERQALSSFPRTAVSQSILSQIKGPPYDPRTDFLNYMMYAIASMHNDPATLANAASQNTLVDDGVGRVMAALRKRGFDKNTLVIYSSDQGNFYGHHGLWTHPVVTSPSSIYDIAMNIPLVVWHPSEIAANSTSDALIGQYDIMPTILDYVGLGEVDIAPSPGRSFAGLLRGEESSKAFADAVFMESEETRGVRTDRYAYWKRLKGTGESVLYDMKNDPGQLVNVVGDKEHAAPLAELDRRLDDFFKAHVNPRYDLWSGGTAKGSVDRPEQYRRLFGPDWKTVTTYEPPFEESADAPRPLGDMGLPAQYNQTTWASVHRDSRNSDHLPLVTSSKLRTTWSVLDGAALINPGVIDRKGNHYMTTGRGKGFSHLHAFDQHGQLLWETPPQQGPDDFDALAGFNAPVLDARGHLYVGDGNQFWAFRPDGTVKWVAALPDPGNPFVYQVLSSQGFPGGITVNGTVLFYDPETGELAVPAFQLPPGVAPETGPKLPGLWEGGLFDPEAAELFKQIAFGYKVEVANAPAIHPETGRLFITAAGPLEEGEYTGVLYGIDIGDREITIAFATRMGGGSGTSPALSPGGDLVYSADGEGQMLAVSTATGEVVWASKGEGLLSPAIGEDGTIYTGDIFGSPTVVALSPVDGSQLWAGDYDAFAAAHLPELEPELPALPGKPVTRLVSVISTSINAVWVGMVLGYEYRPAGAPKTLTIPHKTVVCALAPDTGELQDCVFVRDTVEGMIKLGTAGRLYVSHTSIFGSAAYYGFNKTIPERFRNPVKPIGGVTAMEPASYCGQLKREWQAAQQLIEEAKAKADSDNKAAKKAVEQALRQLRPAHESLALAIDRGESFQPSAGTISSAIGAAIHQLGILTMQPGEMAASLGHLSPNAFTITCDSL